MTPCPNPKCDHGYVDECLVSGHIIAGEYHSENTWWQKECPICKGNGFIEQDETEQVTE